MPPSLLARADEVMSFATVHEFRYWHKADISIMPANVRFWG